MELVELYIGLPTCSRSFWAHINVSYHVV